MSLKTQLPKRVTLEFTNRCNRTCNGCPRSKMVYPLGDMNLVLFLSIINQLPGSTVIVPFFRGESLAHPMFALYMNRLKGFREIQLATNADYLTPINQEAILNNCTFISVSLHSYLLPQETKLLQFFEKAFDVGVESQISILDSVLSPKNKKQFVDEWLNHVDNIRIYKTHSVNGFGDIDGKVSTVPCNKPFEEMVVYWNGRVGLCNHDWNNNVLLGDLNVQKISTVWNDNPYQEVRKLHCSGKRGEVLACQHCSFQPNQVYGELIKNGRQRTNRLETENWNI